MNLKDIMAIAGKPGLYKMVATAKNGVVVENIVDHKRIQAFSSDKVSSLEEISIYTETGDMPLKEAIGKIYQKLEGKPTPELKGDNNKIKEFFNEVLPEYDNDRVYVSHMQKILSWYNLLLEQNMLLPETDEVKEEHQDEVVETPTDTEIKDTSQKKTSSTKKKEVSNDKE